MRSDALSVCVKVIAYTEQQRRWEIIKGDQSPIITLRPKKEANRATATTFKSKQSLRGR